MHSEKYELSAETRRSYIVKTLLRGLKNIFTSWRAALVYAMVMLVLGALLQLSCDDAGGFAATMQELLLKVLYLGLFPVAAYGFGYVPGSFAAYRNMVRAGFVNSAGEAPVLIHRRCDGKAEELTFEAKGLPLEDWTDAKETIQTALNMTIGRIKQGEDLRTIIVRAVPGNVQFPPIISWSDDFLAENEAVVRLGKTIADEIVEINIDKQPMMLLAGNTGSGKTNLAVCICYQALKRGAQVTVVDFKGLDFVELERLGATILTKPDAIINALKDATDEIEYRRQLFADVGAKKLSSYRKKTGIDLPRMVVLVDECAMLTDYGTTKEARDFSKAVVDLLSGIARVGRALGVYLIISTQRPDQAAVPGSIKSNLIVHICGRADATLSGIVLGDSRASVKIPEDAQGRFIMAAGADDTVFQAFYIDDED